MKSIRHVVVSKSEFFEFFFFFFFFEIFGKNIFFCEKNFFKNEKKIFSKNFFKIFFKFCFGFLNDKMTK